MSVRAISAYRFCSRVSIRRERAARDHERTFRCILSLSTLSDWFRPDIEYVISIECHCGISVSSVSSVATEGLAACHNWTSSPLLHLFIMQYYLLLTISRRRLFGKKIPIISLRTKRDGTVNHSQRHFLARISQRIFYRDIINRIRFDAFSLFFRILFPTIHYILI